MGVSLTLRLIDHERIVVKGLRATNDAIERNDPEILRRYVATLPIEVDPELVESFRQRLAKLREFQAPDLIVGFEERALRDLTGESYAPAAVSSASFDELREMLGTWCWRNHNFDLDKAWEPLHWFLEPQDATDEPPHFPVRPRVGDPSQSLFDKALHGSQPYPRDLAGEPVIRTLGTPRDDCMGYNPPDAASDIHDALNRVDTEAWPSLLPKYISMYSKALAHLDADLVTDIATQDLAFAQDAFPVLMAAYTRAVQRGFGVSCEFSL